MPSYKYHIVGGFASVVITLIVFFFFRIELDLNAYTTVTLIIIYSILPDIDTDSKARKLLYIVVTIINVYLFVNKQYKLNALLSTLYIVPVFIQHRTITHTKKVVVLMTLPTLYFGPQYFFISLIACLSHLLMDGRINK